MTWELTLFEVVPEFVSRNGIICLEVREQTCKSPSERAHRIARTKKHGMDRKGRAMNRQRIRIRILPSKEEPPGDDV
eukprot:215701-Pelagomonas_calceolata.AAC.4